MLALRVALRRLRRNPGFAAVSVLTLALGIGVNVAIFSLLYGVLLKQLPYPEPERLVAVSHDATRLELDDLGISAPLYLRYRGETSSFEEMGMLRDGWVSLTGLNVPSRLRQGTVTSSLFAVFRVPPLQGRTFTAADEERGAAPVALISERLWRARFGGDPGALGRRIEIDGAPREIVGVMPSHFEVPDAETDVWLPFIIDPEVDHLGSFGPTCIGRLRAGVPRAAALADLKRITDALPEQFPEEHAAPVLARSGFRPRVVPLLENLVGDLERALWVVMGAVGFLLLMVCANLANLFLVRAEARHREIALRGALGATGARIVGSFLVEGLVLALAGGAASVLLAKWAVSILVRFAPEGIPRLHQVGIDAPVLLFALAISLLSGLFFSLLPALPYRRSNLATALREGGRGLSTGRGRLGARQALVIAQIALGLVLLVGAGLMARSFRELMRVSPGFDATGALTLRLSLPATRYETPERIAAFVDRITDRVRALPGVSAVGAVNNLPLSGSASAAGHALEDFPLGENDVPPVFLRYHASPGYREAMGMPLVQGRWLEPADHQQKTGVVVVSQSLARRYWPNASPLGKRIRPGRAGEKPWYTIVGVVSDLRHARLQDEASDMVYYSMLGHQGDDSLRTTVNLVVRTGSSPESLSEVVRSAVWELDANVPVTHVLTLRRLVEAARAPMAFNTLLLVVASALALLLGSVGMYGVISFVVSQRTQEIGVRMALGAPRAGVRSMVLSDGLRVALPGIAIGLAGALAVTRLMKSLLFGVSPLDPFTLTVVPVFLCAVALFSSLLPAERAARVDPVVALREG